MIRRGAELVLASAGLCLLVSAAVFGWPYLDSTPHGLVTIRLRRPRGA